MFGACAAIRSSTCLSLSDVPDVPYFSSDSVALMRAYLPGSMIDSYLGRFEADSDDGECFRILATVRVVGLNLGEIQ